MEFKDKVKQVRDTLVLSQAELAKELGVAFASVNRWENGVRVPTYALQRRFYEYCTLKGIVFTENSKKNGD